MPTRTQITTASRTTGFYSQAFLNAHYLDHQCEEVYDEVAHALAERFKMTPDEVVTYLDGSNGRQLANAMVDEHGLRTWDHAPAELANNVVGWLKNRRQKKATEVPPMPRATTIPAVGQVLAKTLSTEQVAGILNALLGCEAEPALSDAEVNLGEAIFDQLCLLCPEAVGIAQGK